MQWANAMLASSPLRPLRFPFIAYLQERFPLPSTGLFVALFFGSAAAVASALGASQTGVRWAGAVVVLLVFFRLRVADEHKDREDDRRRHPERLLSRGLVTLEQLRFAALIAFVVEVAIVASLGARAAVAWAAVCAFGLLMRWEFGARAWLRRHVVAYALAHNPIVGLLAVFALTCTEASFTSAFAGYAVLASAAALAWEFGRKAQSYAEAVGPRRVRALLIACFAVGAVALAATLSAVGQAEGVSTLRMAIAAAPGLAGTALVWRSPSAAASLFLVSSFVIAWASAAEGA